MLRQTLLMALLAGSAVAEESTLPTVNPAPNLRSQAHTTDRVCPIKLPENQAPTGGWSLQEKWAWERICLGKEARLDRADLSDPGNLGRYLPDNATDGHPCLPRERARDTDGAITEAALAGRSISADFLALVLTRKPWSEAPVTQGVWLQCALFADRIDLGKQTIRPEVVILSSRFEQTVLLFATRFEHSVNLSGSTFERMFYADHIEIDGALYIGGVTSTYQHEKNAAIRLFGGRIARGLHANDVRLARPFDADGLHVGAGLFMRNGNFSAIDLPSSRIQGQLQLSGSRIEDEVDLSGSTVDQITLFRPDEDAPIYEQDPIWGAKARIVLRNVKSEALQAQLDSWKRFRPDDIEKPDEWIEADLTGFRYERLGGYLADKADTMLDEDGDDLADWINKTRPERGKARYEPGPFEQLESALRREGLAIKADEVAYAKFKRRSEASVEAGEGDDAGFWGWLGGAPGGDEWWQRHVKRPISWALVGYGVYPSRAGYWFLAIIALGTALGFASTSLKRVSLIQKFWYAVDNAVPIITLDDRHNRQRHSPLVSTLYHVLKLLGFVLASYLVGALALPGI